MTARSRFLLTYFVAWAPFAALYSLLIYLSSEIDPDRVRSAYGAVSGGVVSIVIASLLGLVVWRVSRRLAERQSAASTAVVAHVLLAIAYSITWTVFIALSIAFFAPPQVIAMFLQKAAGWNALTGLFLYGMVAGIAHAVTVGARLRRERDAASKAEALRARAELSALRAQMNPHFLFNTLHSISALVRTDPGAVEDALERLALLLRRLLNVNRAGADQLALGEEWEIVRDQLELEKLRFGDRLRVVTEIEIDALECQIPIFTMQPLVENAVRHGVAAQTKPCTVTISACVRGETLEIDVRDDGPGADPRTALNASGLGLRAIRQRLLAQYGDRAGLHVESVPGAGFKVRVTLPAVAAPVSHVQTSSSQHLTPTT
jgi:two-component system LytT family sensor kinase